MLRMTVGSGVCLVFAIEITTSEKQDAYMQV